MASIGKADKERVRDWLLERRRSTAPPPPIEQIQQEVYRCLPTDPPIRQRVAPVC